MSKLIIALLIYFSLTPLASADITTGLAAWWKFDEGSGTSTADATGNLHTGTLAGSPIPSWTVGNLGAYALQFSGGTGIVTTVNNLVLGQTATVALWFKRSRVTSYSLEMLMELSTNFNSRQAFYVGFNDNSGGTPPSEGCFIVASCDPTTGYNIYNSNARFDDGIFHHLVVIFDRTQALAADEISIYVDGVLVPKTRLASYGSASSTDYGNYPLFIGARSGGNFSASSTFDDVRVYSRVLSASDILELYHYREKRVAGFTSLQGVTSITF